MKIAYFIASSLHYLPTVLPLVRETGGLILTFKRIPSSHLEGHKCNFKILKFRNYNELIKKIPSLNLRIIVHPSFSIQYFRNIDFLKHVQIFHGTSDKPFNFHRSLGRYDLIAVPGRKMKEDIIKRGLASEEKIVEIGYPKIDYFFHSDFDEDEFKNKMGLDRNKKTVLYCPTWDDPDRYSSSKKFIGSILSNLKDYNVLIKPHPNLFKYRPWLILYTFLFKKKNCFLYPGNQSILPLMKVSDLMVTDISSVSHEYLPFMKPMIFLAPKPIDEIPAEHRWIWHCGDVVETPGKLRDIVDMNMKDPDRYRSEREKALREIFLDFDGKSALRFKKAIEKLISI